MDFELVTMRGQPWGKKPTSASARDRTYSRQLASISSSPTQRCLMGTR